MKRSIVASLLFAAATAQASPVGYEWTGSCAAPAVTQIPFQTYCHAGTVAHVEVILSEPFPSGTDFQGSPWNDYVLSMTYWDHDLDVRLGFPDGHTIDMRPLNPAWMHFITPTAGEGYAATTTDPASLFVVSGLPWRFAVELGLGGYLATGNDGVWSSPAPRSFALVPEPATWALLPLAFAGMAWRKRCRQYS